MEQLRKRQRDEALQAQEELLAGVAKSASKGGWGGDTHADPSAQLENAPQGVPEDVEPYERSMSPIPLELRKLPAEDRQIEIVLQADDIKALVRTILSFHV